MQKATIAILLRIFIGESDRYKGHVLYQYILTYLRKNHYAGATVIRAISGFGRDSILHTSDLLDLSSDLPIVIEIVDSEEKIEALKAFFEAEDILGSGLVTEEKIKIFKYGR